MHTIYIYIWILCTSHLFWASEVKGKTLSLAQGVSKKHTGHSVSGRSGECNQGHAVWIFVASSSPMSSPSPLNPKMGHLLRTGGSGMSTKGCCETMKASTAGFGLNKNVVRRSMHVVQTFRRKLVKRNITLAARASSSRQACTRGSFSVSPPPINKSTG